MLKNWKHEYRYHIIMQKFWMKMENFTFLSNHAYRRYLYHEEKNFNILERNMKQKGS